jgi:hypothetical protein
MTTLGSTPTKRTHLPELGPRGEGWVVLQGLLFMVVIGSGFLGSPWGGADPTAGSIAGGGLVAAGAVLFAAGILAMRRQLTAYPMPVPDGRLIEREARLGLRSRSTPTGRSRATARTEGGLRVRRPLQLR